jgi:hypothetical protein
LKNSGKATQTELNSLQVQLDNAKAQQEISRKSAAEAILKDYKAFSGEDIEKLANALGEDYN